MKVSRQRHAHAQCTSQVCMLALTTDSMADMKLLKHGLWHQPTGTGYMQRIVGLQVALLRSERSVELAAVEVATVDGFQGREKEAIIITAVRSNPTGEVSC